MRGPLNHPSVLPEGSRISRDLPEMRVNTKTVDPGGRKPASRSQEAADETTANHPDGRQGQGGRWE